MSYCQIDVDVDDSWSDGPYENSSKTTVATKQRICCECKSKIEAGDEYVEHKTQFYAFDEELDDYLDDEFDESETTIHNWCIGCQSIVDTFFNGSWYFETIWEHMQDCLQEYDKFPEDKVNQLNEKGKELFFAAIEEYWEEIDD